MGRTTSVGTCDYCRRELSKGAAAKHLAACKGREKGEEDRFVVLAEGRHLPQYWMALDVLPELKLDALDRFLRKTWLECCGHVSAFSMQRQPVGKGRRIEELAGAELGYAYDFGSTTELRIRIGAQPLASVSFRNAVKIAARNIAPKHVCECGTDAAHVCSECQWDGAGFVCVKCAKKHECGEEMLLPLVNSPRAGVCGYGG